MAVRVIEGDYEHAIIFGFNPPFINDPEDGKIFLNKKFVKSYNVLSEVKQEESEPKKKGFLSIVGQKTKKSNKVEIFFLNGKRSVIDMTDDVYNDFMDQMK